MWNIMKLQTVPQTNSENERLRLIAQQALTPPHFPFDGLHIGADVALDQLGLAADIPSAVPDRAPNFTGRFTKP